MPHSQNRLGFRVCFGFLKLYKFTVFMAVVGVYSHKDMWMGMFCRQDKSRHFF